MNNLKESILNNAKKGRRDTTNPSNETTSHTTNASNETTSLTNIGATSANNTTTTRSNDAYAYGVGILAVLAIGVCVFFAYNTFPNKKKQANEKRDQPPKICHML